MFRIRQAHATCLVSFTTTLRTMNNARHELRGHWTTWLGTSPTGAHQLHNRLIAVEFDIQALGLILWPQTLGSYGFMTLANVSGALGAFDTQ